MSVSNDRRIYVTFDSPSDVERIKRIAAERETSASKVILAELALLERVKADPVGAALVKTLNGQKP